MANSSEMTAEPEIYRHVALLYQQGRDQEAEKICVELLNNTNDLREKTTILWTVAQIHLENRDYQQAIECWNQAASMAIEVAEPGPYELLGTIFLNQYRDSELDARCDSLLDQAVRAFEQALAHEPEPELRAAIYHGLGLAYRDKEALGPATEWLNKALTLHPRDRALIGECYLELGLIELWDRDDPKKALPLFRQALETYPQMRVSNWRAHTYWCLAHALVQAGELPEAIRAGKSALKAVDLDDEDSYYTLHLAHRVLGWAYSFIPAKRDVAISHYQKALAVQEDSVIYRRLGEIYYSKEDYVQALKMFETALRVEPDQPNIGDMYYAVGACLAQIGRHEEAITYLEAAREEQATITFEPARIFTSLGLSYEHVAKYAEAGEALRTALKLMKSTEPGYSSVEAHFRQVQSRFR